MIKQIDSFTFHVDASLSLGDYTLEVVAENITYHKGYSSIGEQPSVSLYLESAKPIDEKVSADDCDSELEAVRYNKSLSYDWVAISKTMHEDDLFSEIDRELDLVERNIINHLENGLN